MMLFSHFGHGGKVTIILALAVFAVSASANAEEAQLTLKPSRVAIFCTNSGEQVSGLTKVCYYNCARSEGALTTKTYESCPRWTPRWQLNRNSQFGPSANSR